jgi:hypothetical protein
MGRVDLKRLLFALKMRALWIDCILEPLISFAAVAAKIERRLRCALARVDKMH